MRLVVSLMMVKKVSASLFGIGKALCKNSFAGPKNPCSSDEISLPVPQSVIATTPAAKNICCLPSTHFVLTTMHHVQPLSGKTLTEVATVCDCGLPIHSSCKVQHVPRNVCVFYKVLTAVSGCLHRCHKQQTSFFLACLFHSNMFTFLYSATAPCAHILPFVPSRIPPPLSQAANMLPQRLRANIEFDIFFRLRCCLVLDCLSCT